MRTLLATLRDAVLVTVACAALALGVNAARPTGLPLVAREPYQLVVPCPVISGDISQMAPGDPRLSQPGTLVVDARSKTDFAAGHLPAARSVPYDYLDVVSPKEIQAILGSGMALVAVYGDGQDPDSGRELAKEIAGKGVRNVFVVQGGAPALGVKKP